MKIVKKKIDIVCWFNKQGIIHPVKFRLTDENGLDKVISIDRIVHTDLEKFAGNKMMVFTCESIIRGGLKRFVLKYELESSRWILFKI